MDNLTNLPKQTKTPAFNLAKAITLEISENFSAFDLFFINFNYVQAFQCLRNIEFRISNYLDKDEKKKLSLIKRAVIYRMHLEKQKQAVSKKNTFVVHGGKRVSKTGEDFIDIEELKTESKKIPGFPALLEAYNVHLMSFLDKYGLLIPSRDETHSAESSFPESDSDEDD